MKTQITTVFLVIILLAACAPSQAIPADTQNTAMAIVGTYVSLTQTALPIATLPPPTITPTATIVYPTPSPLPTQPSTLILTPDAIQVERWQEYEVALAQNILPMFDYLVLCEWDILGRSGLEVYVWATCRVPGGDDSRPAVIHLGIDGSIQEVEVLKRSTFSNVDELFPKEIQEKFSIYMLGAAFDGRRKEMYEHLIYRETHPEMPPLVVLSSYPSVPSPTP